MGLKGAGNLLFTAKGISLTDLKNVARSRLLEDEHLCCIDVDCSWIGYKLSQGSSSSEDASLQTAELLLLLSKAGFVVTPVCDPLRRHHSKRASTSRIANKERKRINALIVRYQINMLSQRGRKEDLPVEEKVKIEAELEGLNKRVKTLERSTASERLGGTFVEDLRMALENLNAHSSKG